MSDRNRALEVLQEAREILARRLTELVVEQADDILADARGDSYMNEIESLYEQVGMKLAHISQMVGNLPALPVETTTTTAAAPHDRQDTFTVATEAGPRPDAVVEDLYPALAGPMPLVAPALPPPRSQSGSRTKATQQALQAFAAQIQAGDLMAAGRTIGALFELEDPRAIACAATFAQRARTEAGHYRKLLAVRVEAHAGRNDQVVALLHDCFGLARPEAHEVLQTLRWRLKLEV
ncbi:MAG: hypothetical protein SFU86_10475 [Pirellulaceae bacterium]|nr:hypothetical protein [Pirellulaceae bacterium]